MFNHYRMDHHKTHSFSSYGTKKVGNFSYSSLDKVGKGFSSVVYKGKNQQTKEIIAIKAIDMKGIKDSVSRQMLECQIEVLKTLNHKNILRCHDVVREPSYCYIITEFCNQGDLSDLLKKKKFFSQNQTIQFLKDIVSGFVEIGINGFLHRDLKLANILLHEGKAKIADFGFAKKSKSSSEREKYNVGSPLYMSPEALKKNIYSLKNDIWSIGIMAYELLHGTTPWQCRTEKQLMEKMTKIPVRFRDSIPLSADMKDFIRKCLQVDERKRMSLEDLKDWLSCHGQCENKALNQQECLRLKKQQNLSALNLSHKPNSEIQKIKSQITERPTNRNKTEKENVRDRLVSTEAIPKSIIEKNNTVMINEINTFRLQFKIFEKLKKKFSTETSLLDCLGRQVINRVNKLKKCCEEQTEEYNLISMKRYLDEKINPSIKKYKSVVKEYYKKYTEEIKVNGESKDNLKILIQHFLQRNGCYLKEGDELLMGFWMVEFLKLESNTSKEQLDAIIEPKLKINKPYIEKRLRQLR